MKHDDLVAADLVDRLGQDLGPLHMRVAQIDLLVAGNQQDLVQLNLAPRLNSQAINFDNLPGGNPVLLPSGFNYGVNGLPPPKDAV